MKKFFTMLFAIALVMVALTCPALAVEGATPIDDNSLTWNTWGGIDWAFAETDPETGNGKLIIRKTTKAAEDLALRNTGPAGSTPFPWTDGIDPTDRFLPGEMPAALTPSLSYYRPYQSYANKVTAIEIREGVISIGAFTCNIFPNLTGELVIPKTVGYIGWDSFNEGKANIGLTSIIFEVDETSQESALRCIA